MCVMVKWQLNNSDVYLILFSLQLEKMHYAHAQRELNDLLHRNHYSHEKCSFIQSFMLKKCDALYTFCVLFLPHISFLGPLFFLSFDEHE